MHTDIFICVRVKSDKLDAAYLFGFDAKGANPCGKAFFMDFTTLPLRSHLFLFSFSTSYSFFCVGGGREAVITDILAIAHNERFEHRLLVAR